MYLLGGIFTDPQGKDLDRIISNIVTMQSSPEHFLGGIEELCMYSIPYTYCAEGTIKLVRRLMVWSARRIVVRQQNQQDQVNTHRCEDHQLLRR
jgi:hypothetical protein